MQIYGEKLLGMRRLMEELIKTDPIEGLVTLRFSEHPFGKDLPKANRHFNPNCVHLVGYPYAYSSTRGIIRIVGHLLAEGFGKTVEYIRVIRVGNLSKEGHDGDYYEFLVGHDLLLSSNWGNSSFRYELPSFAAFLSETYDVPIDEGHVSKTVADRVENALRDMAENVGEIQANVEYEHPYTFSAGEYVGWCSRPIQGPDFEKIEPTTTFKVIEVEEIPNHCSCPMGPHVDFILHPERCNIRRRLEQIHGQMVTIETLAGPKKLSGCYFFPVEAPPQQRVTMNFKRVRYKNFGKHGTQGEVIYKLFQNDCVYCGITPDTTTPTHGVDEIVEKISAQEGIPASSLRFYELMTCAGYHVKATKPGRFVFRQILLNTKQHATGSKEVRCPAEVLETFRDYIGGHPAVQWSEDGYTPFREK